MEKETRLIKSRRTLATLADIYEGRHTDAATTKTRQPYRMNQYHIDMLRILAAESGLDLTKVLRRIINEWFELKRIQALQSE